MTMWKSIGLRALPLIQQPSYPDRRALDRTIDSLEKLPPLVFAGECDDLRLKLADVADGKVSFSYKPAN